MSDKKSETPRTDELFRRHCDETIEAVKVKRGIEIMDHAVQQSKELLEHARTLERENNELRQSLAGFCAELGEENVVSAMVKLQAKNREREEMRSLFAAIDAVGSDKCRATVETIQPARNTPPRMNG